MAYPVARAGAARPWSRSRPPRWLAEAALAAAARGGRAAGVVDAVLGGFVGALWMRGSLPRVIVPHLARWVGGQAGCAVVRFGCASVARASYVAPRLALLAVPLFLLRTLGRALMDAESQEDKGPSKVKGVSIVEDRPESKVEWWQLAKCVNFSVDDTYGIVLFVFFVSDWMRHAIEDGSGKATIFTVLADVGYLCAYIISAFVLLMKVISKAAAEP